MLFGRWIPGFGRTCCLHFQGSFYNYSALNIGEQFPLKHWYLSTKAHGITSHSDYQFSDHIFLALGDEQ